ncbi:hypothetical protein ABXJ76_02650 [Methylobacter sp. G7]
MMINFAATVKNINILTSLHTDVLSEIALTLSENKIIIKGI